MPTSAMTALATITLGSAQASVTFSGISSAYRDLVVICHYKAASSGSYPIVNFNGDLASNYTWVEAVGTGSAASTSKNAGSGEPYIPFGNGYLPSDNVNPQPVIINVLDYSAIDKLKTALIRANASATGVSMVTGRWANTAAITSLRINGNGVNIGSGSTFTLYGVSA